MKKQNAGPALKHSLGQNFILDEGIQAELADFTGITKEDYVLEIGAGSGMLTKQLAQRCDRMIAVEVDREMIPWLKAATLSCENVEVVQGDVLHLSLSELTSSFDTFHIVANLPYHITSQLMTKILNQPELPIVSMHFMLQKESALKLCAKPGEDGYGPLPIRTQWYFEPVLRKIYPPEVFTPPPKVESAFISLYRRKDQPALPIVEKTLFKVVTGVFAQKRKTLLNNLIASFHLSRGDALFVLTELSLPENTRAETMDINQLIRLAEAMSRRSLL